MKRSLLIWALLSTAVHAQTALKSSDWVELRSGPSYDYGGAGWIPPGHVHVGFEKDGDWWKVWFDGGEAWVDGWMFEALPGTTGVKVTTDVLNVRTGPGTGYSIQGQVYLGQIYFWTQHQGLNGWYKIYWGGGIGYVYGGYVTQVALSEAPPEPAPEPSPEPPSDLPMPFYWQINSWYCGPATAQMITHYISGAWYGQGSFASYMGTSSTYGTSAQGVANGINYFAYAWYWVAGYSRDRIVDNIHNYRPVNINIKTSYLAYWGYSYALHHSPVKGYTSGGYYIHDSYLGPDQWASSTEVYNAVVYHYNMTCVEK